MPDSDFLVGEDRFHSQFEDLCKLGKGAFGDVLKATDKENKRVCAVKVLNKKTIVRLKKTKYVKQERDINARCNHVHVVQFIRSFSSPTNLYYILELCENGDLQAQLSGRGAFPVEAATHCAAEILEGLAYIHSQGVIHRDLKPENCLLSKGFHVKIGDFGAAKLFGTAVSPDAGAAESADADPVTERVRGATFVGSVAYMAPELLTEKETCPESDWYSFGSMVFELLVGRPPYRDKSDYLMMERIKSNEFSWPDECQAPQTARDLVAALLEAEPEKRLGARSIGGPKSIRDHEFFSAVGDFDQLHSIEASPVQVFCSQPMPEKSSAVEI